MRESSIKQANQLPELAEEIFYKPTEADRKLKIEFWRRVDGNPMLDPHNLPMSEVERIIGRSVPNSKKPGFSAWFLNRNEQAQRLEYLFELALGAAEEILCNTDPKAQSARVNMIKAISELAGKIPGRGQSNSGQSSQNLLQSINNMDTVQLKAFLEKGGASLSIEATKNQPIEAQIVEHENPPKAID